MQINYKTRCSQKAFAHRADQQLSGLLTATMTWQVGRIYMGSREPYYGTTLELKFSVGFEIHRE